MVDNSQTHKRPIEEDMSFMGRHKRFMMALPSSWNSQCRLVAISLFSYAHDDGAGIYVGIERLIAMTGLSRSGVMRSLKTLNECGALIKDGVHTHSNGVQTTLRKLNLSRIVELANSDKADSSIYGTSATSDTCPSATSDTYPSATSDTQTESINREILTESTTHTHAQAQAQEPKQGVKPEPAATDGWLTFGHEVMAAAGVDYTRSMMKAGCVRQWLADAAKAGYTRQQAEAVILGVIQERAKYGGQGKPPAWFNRPVADAIANGSVGASQEAQECGQAEWEGEWRTDYLRHVQSRSNGAGAVMSRDAFRAEWMKEKGIEA